MGLPPNGLERINSYAVVIYIPDPLAKFLNQLRKELVPSFDPHAHVTILPPRPIPATVDAASAQVRVLAADFEPFDIEAGDVGMFATTKVIYLSLTDGTAQLRRMHDAFNRGPLRFEEPYAFEPHITLAQAEELDSPGVDRLHHVARQRWKAFPFQRSFRVSTIHLVQNTNSNHWLDLAEFSLGAVTPVR